MFFINSYLTVGLALAFIAGTILVILRWRRSAATESRMERMMVSCGIDQESASNENQSLNIDYDAARVRCLHCPVTYLCDRWLDGDAVANSSFCPNAWIFKRAASDGQS